MKRLVAVIALAAACTAGHAAEYVNLPGGRFESVLPQGAVPTVSTPVDIQPFAMRTTPVTAAEYARFVATHPQWQRGRAAAVMADKRYLAKWSSPLQPGRRGTTTGRCLTTPGGTRSLPTSTSCPNWRLLAASWRPFTRTSERWWRTPTTSTGS
jgi:formylglycine-generating enzyme required for sulfatase activity